MNNVFASQLALGGFAASSATTIYAAATHKRKLEYLAKPLIGPSLIALVVSEQQKQTAKQADAAKTDARQQTVLKFALAAATAGDIFMLQPDNEKRVTKGAASFAVMHGAYTANFRRSGSKPTSKIVKPLAANWLTAAGLLALKAGTMAPPLALYGTTLSTMAAHAMSVPAGSRGRAAAAGGAGLFVLSDSLVAARRYLAKSELRKRQIETLVLGTYTAAQILLVAGLTAQR